MDLNRCDALRCAMQCTIAEEQLTSSFNLAALFRGSISRHSSGGSKYPRFPIYPGPKAARVSPAFSVLDIPRVVRRELRARRETVFPSIANLFDVNST